MAQRDDTGRRGIHPVDLILALVILFFAASAFSEVVLASPVASALEIDVPPLDPDRTLRWILAILSVCAGAWALGFGRRRRS